MLFVGLYREPERLMQGNNVKLVHSVFLKIAQIITMGVPIIHAMYHSVQSTMHSCVFSISMYNAINITSTI